MIVKTEKGVDVRTQNRWNKILRQNAPFLPPEKPKGREKKSCTMLGLDFGTILSISMTYHPWIVWHTWKYYSISKASSNINGILTFWECGVWPLTMTWTFLDEYSLFQEIKNVLGPLVLRLDNVVLNYDHIWISLSLISFNSLLFSFLKTAAGEWQQSS